MKNSNPLNKYNQFRAKNTKNKKQPAQNDMKEVDKLTKKLDNISFTKRVKNTHLKTEEKPNCQIIKEQEQEYGQYQSDASRQKLSSNKKLNNHKKVESEVNLKIPLKSIRSQNRVQGKKNEKKFIKKDIIYTERHNVAKEEFPEGDNKSLKMFNVQKSTLLSTTNSMNHLPVQKMISKEILLNQVQQIHNKIRQRGPSEEQLTQIMQLLEKVNFIIDNY